MSDAVEIKFSGRQIPPEKFVAAVQHFLAIVQGVGRNIGGSEEPIQWTVETAHGSDIIRARALNRPRESAETTDAVRRGFDSLRTGGSAFPRGFTIAEMRFTKDLASLVDDDFPISIKNGDTPVELSREIVHVVDTMLLREKFAAFGSIEGVLHSMTRGNRFECEIKDQQSGRTVHCYFTTPEAARQAWAAFLNDRILASGEIKYSKEGYPTRIIADSVRAFPDESELPTVQDIQSIFRSYR
jgi:hypothetical protein